MSYVDGFLLSVPEDRLEDYKKMATTAGAVWKEHGALEYKECVIEDGNVDGVVSFNKTANSKANEKTIFAFIVFKSREHRDEVNAKVMADERIKNSCDPNNMPFDCSKMSYSGFQTIVEY